MKDFALSLQVGKNYIGATCKLPDYLPASSTRRCQRFRIGNHRELCKVALSFRQCFPDCHTFRADGQSVTRTLNIASRINFSAAGLDGCAYEKIRKRGHGLKTGLLRGLY